MQPRRCPSCPPTCYIDMNNVAFGIFVFIVLTTLLCVGMQLYLYLNIDAATKSALSKFIDCTTSVQSGVQGHAKVSHMYSNLCIFLGGQQLLYTI